MKQLKNKNMKAIKLTTEQYNRSLKATNKVNHLWVYSQQNTTQRTHNNSIFLGRTIGEPFACIVVLYDATISDQSIEQIFGKGAFIDGAVSPNDKENMNVETYYLKA